MFPLLQQPDILKTKIQITQLGLWLKIIRGPFFVPFLKQLTSCDSVLTDFNPKHSQQAEVCSVCRKNLAESFSFFTFALVRLPKCNFACTGLWYNTCPSRMFCFPNTITFYIHSFVVSAFLFFTPTVYIEIAVDVTRKCNGNSRRPVSKPFSSLKTRTDKNWLPIF